MSFGFLGVRVQQFVDIMFRVWAFTDRTWESESKARVLLLMA